MDDYHGTKVADPYRWLEDDNSEETKAWVKAQNKVTFDYLARSRNGIRSENDWKNCGTIPDILLLLRKADYYYFKNDGLQNQSVMYRQKGLNGKPEEFLNPNTLNKEGIAALVERVLAKPVNILPIQLPWQEVTGRRSM